MPEAGQDAEEQDRGITVFGVASAVLAVIALAAAGLIAVMWSAHHAAESDRNYQARVLQAAAQWTGILININADNVESSMAQLRDGTVGELNVGFEASIAPYRDVVKKLRSKTTGQVESVSIEATHQELDRQPGQRPPAPEKLPSELASRTDTVLVVATSVSENAGTPPAPAPDGPGGAGPTTTDARPGGAGPTTTDARPGGAGPTTVRWNLRLGVSDVDGTLKISQLESLR
jgi:hypothetical protein